MTELQDMARAVAATYGLPPALVCGLIEQESRFNPWLSRYEPAFFTRYVDKSQVHLAAQALKKEVDYVVSFDTELRERAFSRGLMQIMGQTARDMGYKEPLPKLHDPETNVKWGCHYLRKLLDRCAGDMSKALLKYNGGGDPTYAEKVYARAKKYEPQA